MTFFTDLGGGVGSSGGGGGGEMALLETITQGFSTNVLHTGSPFEAATGRISFPTEGTWLCWLSAIVTIHGENTRWNLYLGLPGVLSGVNNITGLQNSVFSSTFTTGETSQSLNTSDAFSLNITPEMVGVEYALGGLRDVGSGALSIGFSEVLALRIGSTS